MADLIPLDTIKRQLRIEQSDTSQDAELTRLYKAALDHAEAYLSRPIPWLEPIETGTGVEVVTMFPRSVEQAILILVTEFYENREQHYLNPVSENPTVRRLLDLYRGGLGP